MKYSCCSYYTSSLFIVFLAAFIITLAAAQNASSSTKTTPESPALRSIKISFDAFETIGGKNLWKIWLNIPKSEQECIQGAVKNEIRNYLSGAQTGLINVPTINATCPTYFKQFKNLYQMLKTKYTKATLQAQTKLPKSVTTAMNIVYSTFTDYRTKQQLRNDTYKIAVIQTLLDEMNKIPAVDMVKIGTVYPQLAEVVQDDGAQNLKAVISDYAKKLKGQEPDPEGARERLQTLLNAIKDGWLKAQNS